MSAKFPIFINPELKKTLELIKVLKGYKSIDEVLTELLKNELNNKYKDLIKIENNNTYKE